MQKTVAGSIPAPGTNRLFDILVTAKLQIERIMKRKYIIYFTFASERLVFGKMKVELQKCITLRI